jgi:hypothetical protein
MAASGATYRIVTGDGEPLGSPFYAPAGVHPELMLRIQIATMHPPSGTRLGLEQCVHTEQGDIWVDVDQWAEVK